jgi:hypothetical protein
LALDWVFWKNIYQRWTEGVDEDGGKRRIGKNLLYLAARSKCLNICPKVLKKWFF